MFEPMALTVIIALAAAFVLSLTFVPAMIAIVITGHVQEKENFFVRWMKVLYEPALRNAVRAPLTCIGGSVALLIMAGPLFTGLGQVFIPTLDEKNIVMNALRVPSTSLSQNFHRSQSCFRKQARPKRPWIRCLPTPRTH
jgi:heavy metal efflux system protein